MLSRLHQHFGFSCYNMRNAINIQWQSYMKTTTEDRITIIQHNMIPLRKDWMEMHILETLFQRTGKEKADKMSMFGQPQCFQFSSRIPFTHQIPSKSKRRLANRKNFRPCNCLLKEGIFILFITSVLSYLFRILSYINLEREISNEVLIIGKHLWFSNPSVLHQLPIVVTSVEQDYELHYL